MNVYLDEKSSLQFVYQHPINNQLWGWIWKFNAFTEHQESQHADAQHFDNGVLDTQSFQLYRSSYDLLGAKKRMWLHKSFLYQLVGTRDQVDPSKYTNKISYLF